MLIELLDQYPAKRPALVPALIIAGLMVIYTVWNLIVLYGRGEKLQGKTMGAIIITLLFVYLAIAAWKDR